MYAYLVTLVGVVLAAISMIHTAVRSLLMAQEFRSHSFMNVGNYTAHFGNFTGNFTGPPRLGYVNPYGGFVNDVAIIAGVIAIVGILWLGIVLNSQHRM